MTIDRARQYANDYGTEIGSLEVEIGQMRRTYLKWREILKAWKHLP